MIGRVAKSSLSVPCCKESLLSEICVRSVNAYLNSVKNNK